jgi:hypothetical protein
MSGCWACLGKRPAWQADITVTPAQSGNRRLVEVDSSGKIAREIPLTGRILTLLSSRRKDSGLIFTFEDKPIGSLKTGWKAAIRRAGIRYIRFHYLRHTFNTRLLELSVPREVRMALLGHTFGDTHESYEHVELPMKREAIRKLILNGTPDAGMPPFRIPEAQADAIAGYVIQLRSSVSHRPRWLCTSTQRTAARVTGCSSVRTCDRGAQSRTTRVEGSAASPSCALIGPLPVVG